MLSVRWTAAPNDPSWGTPGLGRLWGFSCLLGDDYGDLRGESNNSDPWLCEHTLESEVAQSSARFIFLLSTARVLPWLLTYFCRTPRVIWNIPRKNSCLSLDYSLFRPMVISFITLALYGTDCVYCENVKKTPVTTRTFLQTSVAPSSIVKSIAAISSASELPGNILTLGCTAFAITQQEHCWHHWSISLIWGQ